MSDALEEAMRAVLKLDSDELRLFRAWFTEADSTQWDAQIEADAAAGKSDGLMREALNEHISITQPTEPRER